MRVSCFLKGVKGRRGDGWYEKLRKTCCLSEVRLQSFMTGDTLDGHSRMRGSCARVEIIRGFAGFQSGRYGGRAVSGSTSPYRSGCSRSPAGVLVQCGRTYVHKRRQIKFAQVMCKHREVSTSFCKNYQAKMAEGAHVQINWKSWSPTFLLLQE